MRRKSQRAKTQLSAANDLGFKFALSETDSLRSLHLAPRPYQGIPDARFQFAGKKHLNGSAAVLLLRGARSRRGVHAGAVSEQSCRDHPGIVEDNQLIPLQQVWQLAE